MSTYENGNLNRRRVLAGLASTAAVPALGAATASASSPSTSDSEGGELSGRIYKAVKGSMIQGDNLSTLDMFKMARDAGFEGITLFAPTRSQPAKEVIKASEKTGIRVHNVNGSKHWQVRLSDPDPEVREEALKDMKKVLHYAHTVGASSMLLIVGKVTDPKKENHRQVWDRSIEQIRKAEPLAAKLGVHILYENVRNGFCRHPEIWARYIDAIDSPWVGSFFDIGNHDKFGGAPSWIRTLGKRIVKLDVKGWDSGEKDTSVNIGAGTVKWDKVRRALAEQRFTGWATAEVGGGGLERLEQVSANMDQALGL